MTPEEHEREHKRISGLLAFLVIVAVALLSLAGAYLVR